MTRLRAAVLATALSLIACGSGAPAGPPPGGPLPVKVLVVATESRVDTVRGTGQIEATRTAELRAEASGTVAFVGFDDGDEVASGALLVRLHQEAERARLDEATTRETLAVAKHDRIRRLFDRGETAKQELDQIVAERDLAVAAVRLARDGLRRTEVRAPFDGVLGRREVSVGAYVSPATSITRIDDLSEMFAEGHFAEHDASVLVDGATARVTVDAIEGVTFDGVVRFVATRVDGATRTIAVRVSLAPDPRLRPGLVAEIDVAAGGRDAAILVPTQALVPGNPPSVWVVDAEDNAKKAPVKTGLRDRDRIEILEGLAPGDRVVIDGIVKLRPGAPVAPAG